MKNFIRLATNIDVMPLALALHRQAKIREVWREDTYLRDYPQGPFNQIESVILRFPPRTVHETEEALREHQAKFDQHECVDQEIFKIFPEARALIFGVMAAVQGERLGRCMINKIEPGGMIYPHADTEEHAKYYDRFHIVIKSENGNDFRCGDEHVHMRTGEVWWFNNALEHEVINNSREERIHLVIDIRTSK